MRAYLRLIAAAATLASVAAWGINSHFLKAEGTVNDKGALVVSFKVAGLGNNAEDDVTLNTNASATYQCFNAGSNAPQGVPYRVPTQSLKVDGHFVADDNGNIVGQLTAGPPDPAPANAVLKCIGSGNKKLCLMGVSYSGTTLSDSYGATANVTPDPTTRSFAAPTKQNPLPSNCITRLPST